MSDADAAEEFLEKLGLVRKVVVRKKRAEARVANYNVCLDEVDFLGVFIELESLVPDVQDVDIDSVQSEMTLFLGQIGLQGEMTNVPYDTQILESQNRHG